MNWNIRMSRGRLVPGIALLLVAATAGVLLAGCGKQREVQAETRETALTGGDGVRARPYFSPDGQWIAYTEASEPDQPEVRVMPADGGESRRVSPPDIPAATLGWTPNSRAIIVTFPTESVIRFLDLEGAVLREVPAHPLAKFEDVSADGESILWCRLSGDNYDMGLVRVNEDTVWRAIDETPAWEVDGCFGPGPDEVTLARQATFNQTTTELGIFSLSTGIWTPLPLPRAKNSEPAWSPDGRWLVYVSDRAGSSDLWVYDAEHTKLVPLTSGAEEEVSPDWSPDGTRVVFSRVMVTSHLFAGDVRERTRKQITDGEARDVYPQLSPDGEWIAFFRRLPPSGQGPGPVQFCVMPSGGGSIEVLGLGDLTPTTGEWMFAWSPDSRHLAFSADDGTGNVDIYRIPIENGRPDRVTIEPGLDAVPAWSPDGRLLAYTRLSGGESQINVVPATGGLPVQITGHEGLNQAPIWAPDSDRFAYASITPEGMGEIRLARASLPGESRILHASKDVMLPVAWPRGEELVLCLRQTSDNWGYDAVPVDGSPRIAVAEAMEGDDRFFVRFLPGFERHLEQLYPGGMVAFSDGQRMANLAIIDVARLLASEFQASRH